MNTKHTAPMTSMDVTNLTHRWHSQRDEIPTGFIPLYVGISGDSKVDLAPPSFWCLQRSIDDGK